MKFLCVNVIIWKSEVVHNAWMLACKHAKLPAITVQPLVSSALQQTNHTVFCLMDSSSRELNQTVLILYW